MTVHLYAFCLKVQLHFVPTRYKSKPRDNYENSEDAEEIKEERANIGCYRLKTATNYTLTEHERMNTEKKMMQLASLEELVCKTVYIAPFLGGSEDSILITEEIFWKEFKVSVGIGLEGQTAVLSKL